MKAIMLSVRPEWVEKILKGKKTIEIRKSVPKEFKGWVYIYCTKNFPILVDHKTFHEWYKEEMEAQVKDTDTSERFSLFERSWSYDFFGTIVNGKVVARFWFDEYTKKLEVFDTPKELSEFERRYAPRSWCYVEVKEVVENDN